MATVKLALYKYRNAMRAVIPDHLVLLLWKMRPGQRFSCLALESKEPALRTDHHQVNTITDLKLHKVRPSL